MSNLATTVDGLQDVLGICPCCGEIFRLVEGKFLFPKIQPKTCDYLELVAGERKLLAAQESLQAQVDRFEQRLEAQRERWRDQGRRRAKRRLRQIDPTFSGNDVDPQDVKAIFHPVEYVIFHGLCSEKSVSSVELVSRLPTNRAQETVLRSVDDTVRRGDVGFETLRMRDDGSFDVTPA